MFSYCKNVQDFYRFLIALISLLVFIGQTVDPHEIGIVSSRAPDEYKAFMVAYFKTPSHVRVRTTRAARKKKQERYYDLAGYNPYSK